MVAAGLFLEGYKLLNLSKVLGREFEGVSGALLESLKREVLPQVQVVQGVCVDDIFFLPQLVVAHHVKVLLTLLELCFGDAGLDRVLHP